MNVNVKEQKLILERYIHIVKLRFNIKREYLTVALPIFAAILFLSWALFTGHTFFPPEGEGGGDLPADSEEAAKKAAYEALIAEMEAADAAEGGETATAVVEEGAETEPEPEPEEEKTKADMDRMLVFAFMIATIPYSIDIFREKRLLKKREVAFSEFLFKLSELMRGGIDPIKGVISLSNGELGAIKKSVQDSASFLVLGHSFEYSMNRLAEAIGSKLVSKYINIVVQAAHTGGDVADLIFRTSEDMRAVISIEREKDDNLKQYIIIFYLAQGIIIMLVYILSTSLLPLIQGVGAELLGGQGLSDINFERGFFHMILLNALFGGFIIGMITEGDLKHGLKHSNILLGISYIACVSLILPGVPVADYAIDVVSGGGQESLGGLPLSEPVVFKVSDLEGNPAKDVFVEMSISPGGVVKSGPTNAEGLISVEPLLREQAGVYTIKATAGESFNTTTVTVVGG